MKGQVYKLVPLIVCDEHLYTPDWNAKQGERVNI